MPNLWWQDKAAITGIGQAEYGLALGRSETDLAAEAITRAVQDAGLRMADIDGISCYSTQVEGSNNWVHQRLGIGNASYYVSVAHGGGGYPAVVGAGALGVAGGQCRHLIAYRSRARGRRSSWGPDSHMGGRPWEKFRPNLIDTWQYHVPFGLTSPVQEIAMIAKRLMHQRGVTEEHFANVAVAARKHASRNPAAIMREVIGVRQHRASRMVAEPLRLLDCCLESDGAAAVVISRTEEAKSMPRPPALLHAFAQHVQPAHYHMTEWFRMDRDALASGLGRRLFEQSDVRHDGIAAAMLFDHFTPMVLLSLEDLGFCGRGEGGAFSEGGALEWPDGRLPVNTHGGQLSEAFVHGFNNVLEAVRQIRGTSSAQVPGAKAVLVAGAASDPSSAIILRGDV